MALQSSNVNADDLATASQYNNLRADLISHTHDGVDTAKLGAGSVSSTELADGSVTTTKLTDGAVTTTKIANGAVTAEKLASGAAIPTGTIMPYAGAAEPSGWLFCDGRAVSRTTYAALFAVIGTTYGAGDGSTTFNLPNLKGRVPVGLDTGQSEFNAMGKTGGTKTHTLTAAELPSHTHGVGTLVTQSAGAHSHTTNTAGAHTHAVRTTPAGGSPQSPRKVQSEANWGGVGDVDISDAALSSGAHTHTTDTQGAHTHALSGNTAAAGSGAAHNNLQPYLTLNYIIKT